MVVVGWSDRGWFGGRAGGGGALTSLIHLSRTLSRTLIALTGRKPRVAKLHFYSVHLLSFCFSSLDISVAIRIHQRKPSEPTSLFIGYRSRSSALHFYSTAASIPLGLRLSLKGLGWAGLSWTGDVRRTVDRLPYLAFSLL